MEDLFKTPEFQDLLKKNMSKHELNVVVGEFIRKNYPKPLEAFPQLKKEAIAKALVATCSTEQEIMEVMSAAGIDLVAVSVMKAPTDKAGREALALCQAIGGSLTKDGMPCMTMFLPEYPKD